MKVYFWSDNTGRKHPVRSTKDAGETYEFKGWNTFIKDFFSHKNWHYFIIGNGIFLTYKESRKLRVFHYFIEEDPP